MRAHPHGYHTGHRSLAVLSVACLFGSLVMIWSATRARAADPDLERQVEALVKQRMSALTDELRAKGVPDETIRAITHQAEFELSSAVGKELESGGTPNAIMDRATALPSYLNAPVNRDPVQWAKDNGHVLGSEATGTTGATANAPPGVNLPPPNSAGYGTETECIYDLTVIKGYTFADGLGACNELQSRSVISSSDRALSAEQTAVAVAANANANSVPAEAPNNPAANCAVLAALHATESIEGLQSELEDAGMSRAQASALMIACASVVKPLLEQEKKPGPPASDLVAGCGVLAALHATESIEGLQAELEAAGMDRAQVSALMIACASVAKPLLEPEKKPQCDPNKPQATILPTWQPVAEADYATLWAGASQPLGLIDTVVSEVQSFWSDALAAVANCCDMPAPKKDDTKTSTTKDSGTKDSAKKKSSSRNDNSRNDNSNNDNDDEEDEEDERPVPTPVLAQQSRPSSLSAPC